MRRSPKPIHIDRRWAGRNRRAAFLSRAEEMANKALSLDDSEVRAHIILGRIHIFHHRYEQAKAEMDRAIAINPNDAHGLAGRGNILMWSGTDGCRDRSIGTGTAYRSRAQRDGSLCAEPGLLSETAL